MRTFTPLLLAAAALAALAPAAGAKQIAKVEVCGALGCTTLDRDDMNNAGLHRFAEVGPAAQPPDRAAPWYRIRITVRAGRDSDRWSTAYVPSAGLLRARSDGGTVQWFALPPGGRPLLRRAVEGLEPFPARTLTGLHARLPEARVDEVVLPPQEPTGSPGGSGSPWLWLIAAPVLLLLAGAVRFVRRRGRVAPAHPA